MKGRTLGFILLVIAQAPLAGASSDVNAGEGGHEGPPTHARPGDRVEDHGVSVVVGRAGEGVGAEVILSDGRTQLLEVATHPDGQVEFRYWGDDSSPDGSGSSDPGIPPVQAPDSCTDSTYNRLQWKWQTAFKWYYKSSETPSGLSATTVADSLKKAASNITGSVNPCGMADEVDATHSYQGTTTRSTNIGSTNTCDAPSLRDTYSVVSFGDLTSDKVGYACWYFNTSTNAAQEVDIKLNKVEYTWYVPPSTCILTSDYSVEAVATHEFGHAFGMAHVTEDTHGNLTMSTNINGPCQNAEADLGRGDVLGLRLKY